jgi:outer membrane protein TolC
MAGRNLAIALGLIALGGCASFSPDGGFDDVGKAVSERTGADARWLRSDADRDAVAARVNELLSKPIGPDQAVQIALLNNRGLQAAYAELGISEAERVQAGRWVNPGFSYEYLTRADELEITRKLVFDVLALFTMPRRVAIATQRFEAAKLRAAADALQAAADARRAWFDAVAAVQSAQYAAKVKASAEAGAELATQMARVGNFSALDQAREQAFNAEAGARLARARQESVAASERLARSLGLAEGPSAFRLPERLPDLPKAPREPGPLEGTALRERLDVQAAVRDAEALATSLGLTRATRYIDVLELGAEHNSASGQPAQKGWELGVRLPVFDLGDARVSNASQRYVQAVDRAAQIAVNARSEVREAYAAYRTAFTVAAQYRDDIVPLRQKISEESLLRYNGMLLSVFELLADAREQAASVDGYIRALRDFWLSESDLQMALAGRAPRSMQ